MQIKTMKYYFTPKRLAKMTKTDSKPQVQEFDWSSYPLAEE